jgi:uncharacterized membrane protein
MQSRAYSVLKLLVFPLSAALPACGTHSSAVNGSSSLLTNGRIGYNTLSQAIFQPKCVACHSSQMPSGGIDLSTYSGALGSGVVPGSPGASRLYTVVASGTMPKGGSPLSQDETGAIFTWILQGAPEYVPTAAPAPTPVPAPAPTPTTSSTPTPTPPVPAPTGTPTCSPNGNESETGACPQPTPAPSPSGTGTPIPSPTVSATFAAVYKNVLQPRCVSCHSGSGAPRGIDLSSYAQVMATGSVVAGSPSQSSLYTATSSGIMPPGGALPASEVQLISAWIAAGAPNN